MRMPGLGWSSVESQDIVARANVRAFNECRIPAECVRGSREE